MINILLEGYNIDADFLYNDLKSYFKPNQKVAVIAFSFRKSRVNNNTAWESLYSPQNGMYYSGIVDGFRTYGIIEENIVFLNYFNDTIESAKEKINNSDILYFLGGLPDKMYERLVKFELLETIITHKGIIMGYSAGAVIQFSEYFLSTATGAHEFTYYKGIGFINDFYLSVHYVKNEEHLGAIKRVIHEKGKRVYALHNMAGGIVIDNGEIKLLGKVEIFD